MSDPYGPKLDEHEHLPQTHGERGGEAGEASPNAPSYYEKSAEFSFRDSSAPICLDVMIVLIILVIIGLLTGAHREFPIVFALMLLGIVVSGVFFAHHLYKEYWYGDGFSKSIKRKAYDPEERRHKWE